MLSRSLSIHLITSVSHNRIWLPEPLSQTHGTTQRTLCALLVSQSWGAGYGETQCHYGCCGFYQPMRWESGLPYSDSDIAVERRTNKHSSTAHVPERRCRSLTSNCARLRDHALSRR